MPLTKAELARLRSLQEKKHREALGLFVVEGEKVVGELLAAGYPFAALYATEAVERGLRARFAPTPLTAAEMARSIAEAASHSGAIAHHMQAVASASDATSHGVTETRAAVTDLARMSETLRGMVAGFVV